MVLLLTLIRNRQTAVISSLFPSFPVAQASLSPFSLPFPFPFPSCSLSPFPVSLGFCNLSFDFLLSPLFSLFNLSSKFPVGLGSLARSSLSLALAWRRSFPRWLPCRAGLLWRWLACWRSLSGRRVRLVSPRPPSFFG